MKRCLVLLTFALACAAPTAASAQIATGNIYGTVVDQQGGALPGANVSVLSARIGGEPRTSVTDVAGQFRFLNLDNGTYTVTVELTGFQKSRARRHRQHGRQRGHPVHAERRNRVGNGHGHRRIAGRRRQEDRNLDDADQRRARRHAAVEGSVGGCSRPFPASSSIASTSAATRAVSSPASSARVRDRVDTMWNLDGVVITDVNSGGASSLYYDFNAFEEVNISTGGNDLRQQTGGIGINFVTRRGTNTFKGNVYVRDQQRRHGIDQPAWRAEDRLASGAARRRLRRQGEPYR